MCTNGEGSNNIAHMRIQGGGVFKSFLVSYAISTKFSCSSTYDPIPYYIHGQIMGVGKGNRTPLEGHKLLYVTLEILVRTSLG